MSQHHGTQSFPAPCIVDEGIVINQDDIKRLLVDLCYVHYIYTHTNISLFHVNAGRDRTGLKLGKSL